MEIRRLTAADAALLDHVDDDVFDLPVQPALAAQFLSRPDHLLVVARVDGVVVGMASGVIYLHPDKPLQLFINEVGVSARMEGRGIGTALMQSLLQHGRDLGCVEAWVATETDNTRARALYAKVGGQQEPEPAVVYVWPLQGDKPL